MKEIHIMVVDLDKSTTGEEYKMFETLEKAYELVLRAYGFTPQNVFLRAVEGLPVTVKSPTGEIRFVE